MSDSVPCNFSLHYRRADPDDIESHYILYKYNLMHSHPLDLVDKNYTQSKLVFER